MDEVQVDIVHAQLPWHQHGEQPLYIDKAGIDTNVLQAVLNRRLDIKPTQAAVFGGDEYVRAREGRSP